MARPIRDKIFIGGKVHPNSAEEKSLMAERIKIIEERVTANSFVFHGHPLRDLRVYSGKRPPAQDVILGGKSMQERMDSLSELLTKRLEKLRDNKDNPYFKRDVAIGEYLHECLRTSKAGIFDLTLDSEGSYYEIGILRQANIPVLTLSNRDRFSSTLTGDPSPGVQIRLYKSPEHLGEIVDTFLRALGGLKVGQRTVTLQDVTMHQIRIEAAYRNVDFSEALEAIVSEYFLIKPIRNSEDEK